MDAKTAAKQLDELVKALGRAYVLLAATLRALPAPMNLPRQAGDPALALRSLDLAWDLAAAEALPAVTVARIRTMITAWTSAYETAQLASTAGPAPRRLRAIEDAITRIREAAADINRHLEGDFRTHEVTDAERAQYARKRRRR